MRWLLLVVAALTPAIACSSGSEAESAGPEVQRRADPAPTQERGTARSGQLDRGDFPPEARMADIQREIRAAQAEARQPPRFTSVDDAQAFLAEAAAREGARRGIAGPRMLELQTQLADERPEVRCEAIHRMQHNDHAPSAAQTRAWSESGCEEDVAPSARCVADPNSDPECGRLRQERRAMMDRNRAFAREFDPVNHGAGAPPAPPDLEVPDELSPMLRASRHQEEP